MEKVLIERDKYPFNFSPPSSNIVPINVMEKVRVRSKIIVALDFPHAQNALNAAEKLRGHVGVFKVGSELFNAAGPALIRDLVAGGDKVFLDLKFNDIPNTVKAAAREAAKLGVSMFTVHANGGRNMMEAALEGARVGAESGGKQRPLIVAVTVLTSLGARDLAEIGYSGNPEEIVVRLAQLARAAGVDGVVASSAEISAIRKNCGAQFVIVTPGIRPALAPDSMNFAQARPDDQVRIATPGSAIGAGADYLVVGRPITQAPDPTAAADAIVGEMEKALESAQS
ncbi:MAG TPA: orotidine-5'-phosphate decarboxylase [Terriglobia bacterium]|nr:orotidine-5'-phosphate decarboxylase [Terriglobia bacterium]